MSSLEHCLRKAVEYPYDTSKRGTARKAKDWAVVAARAVLADLSDRRGIKWELEAVDHDVRKEIVDSLAAIIRSFGKEGDAT